MRLLRSMNLLRPLLAAILALVATAGVRAQDACGEATNDCFTTNLLGGGCSNPVCCGLVCSIEPACCDAAWDDVCVSLATKFCSDCGLVEQSCFEPHPTPSCNNGAVCEFVCAVPGYEHCCLTEWDESCVRKARDVTDECGEPATGSCLGIHENPNCQDAECCNQVCAIDPRCCQISWDETCVQWAERYCFTCGNPLSGSCCHQHRGPYCDDPVCCEAVCATDPFCCSARWDSVCARRATVDGVCTLPLCRCGVGAGQPMFSCRTVHEAPGCNDRICCDQVCYIDDFCCAAEWDYTCVQLALANCALAPDPNVNVTCNAASGSCFVPHGQPGCSEPACCADVCTADPTCCSVGWDADCVSRATILCNNCGDLDAGSCFWPHGNPGCIDGSCCDRICNNVDPTCCTVSWDIFCVINAGAYCTDDVLACGDIRTRPCSVASYLPACEDETCCIVVCNFDPTCCSRAWDETCAVNAIYTCGLSYPNCPSSGSPLAQHGPGCVDELCCSAVCSLDPLCCTMQWSAACIQLAKSVCVTFGTCPGSGPCGRAHAEPGCSDPTCCAIVCAADPICCDVAWSAPCAARARAACVPASSWQCPCVGSCFESRETPGCEDETCCAGVCSQDPLCCTESWDVRCAALARIVCCTGPACGNNCAGSCLVSHASPYCDDPSCCEAVCRFDEYCCEVRWDQSCVILARQTCLGGCGLPVAGSCYAVHAQPGCADGDCCASVCAAEEFEYCCLVNWDEDCANRARKLCADALPECGDIGLPGCNLPHGSPGCSDAACCAEVCQADPFCCDNEWDATCVASIYGLKRCERYQPECGGECAGSCCEPHSGPWCNDAECCDAVCMLDMFCCTTEWDAACASRANLIAPCQKACPDPECGTAEAGDCCVPHDNANCRDLTCCERVCAIDSYCCDAVWDVNCAGIANVVCEEVCGGGGVCGGEGTGSCCNEHPTPFCNNASCCAAVCSFDESCCFAEWDATCVKLATLLCPNCQ